MDCGGEAYIFDMQVKLHGDTLFEVVIYPEGEGEIIYHYEGEALVEKLLEFKASSEGEVQ